MEKKNNEESLSALVPLTGNITAVSLDLPAKLTRNQWVEIGLGLGRLEQARQWWIGDWWAFGEHKYGERTAIVESEDWTGPAYDTCRHASTTCKAFESGRRRPLLTFKHHLTLAPLKLKPALVEELLDWCEAPLKNGAKKPRSVRELEVEIVKRHNNALYDAVLKGLSDVIKRRDERGKLTKSKFEKLEAEIILALTSLVQSRTAEGIRVTLVELELARDRVIDETLGSASEALLMLTEFMGPIRLFAQREPFDFDLMATVVSTVKEDLQACKSVRRQIDSFIEAVNQRKTKEVNTNNAGRWKTRG